MFTVDSFFTTNYRAFEKYLNEIEPSDLISTQMTATTVSSLGHDKVEYGYLLVFRVVKP